MIKIINVGIILALKMKDKILTFKKKNRMSSYLCSKWRIFKEIQKVIAVIEEYQQSGLNEIDLLFTLKNHKRGKGKKHRQRGEM